MKKLLECLILVGTFGTLFLIVFDMVPWMFRTGVAVIGLFLFWPLLTK